MKALLATTVIVTGALLAGGCATKKYVLQTTAPIQAKVNQVGEQTNANTKQIEDTRNQVKQVDDKATAGINAVQERATTADQHAAAADQKAVDAISRANQANQLGAQNTQGITQLRQVVSNIDDYKLQTSAAVQFDSGKFALSAESQQTLDKLVNDIQSGKRFFIAVQGFTDYVGTEAENLVLSRRRADAVVNYLVGKKDIPVYRIHIIGLGEAKQVDEAKTKDARAKNRRVEIQVFNADAVTAGLR